MEPEHLANGCDGILCGALMIFVTRSIFAYNSDEHGEHLRKVLREISRRVFGCLGNAVECALAQNQVLRAHVRAAMRITVSEY